MLRHFRSELSVVNWQSLDVGSGKGHITVFIRQVRSSHSSGLAFF